MPASTYSWLSRDKLISVRGMPIGYSLISQYVRQRKIYGIHLPELYDEIGRRLMYEANRKIGLTEIRTLLLAAHMRLPLLTFETAMLGHLEQHLHSRELWELEAHADPESISEVLKLYRGLQTKAGEEISRQIAEGTRRDPVEEARKRSWGELQVTAETIERLGKTANPGRIRFRCLGWNLKPVAKEYSRQQILQPGTIREVCERALVLVASPV